MSLARDRQGYYNHALMAASRRSNDARRSHEDGTAGIDYRIGREALKRAKEEINATYLGIPRHGLGDD
jgi:hypothetical protein